MNAGKTKKVIGKTGDSIKLTVENCSSFEVANKGKTSANHSNKLRR